MKKKITLIITCVTLVAAIAVGGTLAWFTDKAEVTNTVTFGNVDISLTEPAFDELTSNDRYLDNVLPGDEIGKDPTITNTGANDAWIRAKITTTLPVGATAPTDGIDTIYNIDTTKWVFNQTNGYYYYNVKLAAQNDTDDDDTDVAVLFDEVTIPTNWTNTISFKDLKIEVNVEAVQADNNGAAYTDANWPDTIETASSASAAA